MTIRKTTSPPPLTLDLVRNTQQLDPTLLPMIRRLTAGDDVPPYKLVNEILHHQEPGSDPVVVVPTSLRDQVLQLFHDSSNSVHLSRDRMIDLLRKRYHWPSLTTDVGKWVAGCLTCNKIKSTQPLQNGLLVPIRTSSPFEIVGIDILGPFKITKDGYKYVLICIDLFTSWVEATPLKSLTAEETAQAFFRLIISRHGCPKNVLTDQGKQFTSTLFQALCSEYGIKKLESTAYHHQTNGKAERFNRFLLNAMATQINKDHTNWDQLLDKCLMIYRVSISRMLDETPFFLLHGRDPILPQDVLTGHVSHGRNQSSSDVNEFKVHQLRALKATFDKLNRHKQTEQTKYKAYYDKSHRQVSFQINDLVLVFFGLPKKGLTHKLLPRWEGPYKITGKIDSVTYRVVFVRAWATRKNIFESCPAFKIVKTQTC